MIRPSENAGGDTQSPPKPDLAHLVDAIFRPGGWLQAALGLEHRPQQERMAKAVAQALLGDKPLIFEAGTGVGKSLAYLIPSIIFAMTEQRQAVVSTHTKTLQLQIRDGDLPLCRRIFESVPELAPFAAFRHAILAGKANYLCNNRLRAALAEYTHFLDSDTIKAGLLRIADWATATPNGFIEGLNPPPHPEAWDLVNADSHACNRKHCNPNNCCYRRAKAQVDQAHIVVVNHSLLFALVGTGISRGFKEPGILRPRDFLILDEGHTVPDVATEYFGRDLSESQLNRWLNRLHKPERKGARGLLHQIDIEPHLLAQACEAIEESAAGTSIFFQNLRFDLLAKASTLRLRQPQWAPPLPADPISRACAWLERISAKLEDTRERQELDDLRSRMRQWQLELSICVDLGDEQDVFWLEHSGNRRHPSAKVRSAPLDVGSQLREALFDSGVPIVLTSATLAAGGDMDPFRESCGAEGVEARIEASPFDFDRNMEVLLLKDAPDPSLRDANTMDVAWQAEVIARLATDHPGGTLVLFTSHADLKAVGRLTEAAFTKAGRTVLQQGAGLPRHEIISRMRELGNAVLLGTDTYWTGIDIPGPALSQVIITRLPFTPPSQPVTEARAERISARGGSPFVEMTLPNALRQFRQGVGRLIRKHTDSGRVVILDPRILTKPYGKRFLASLPTRRHKVTTATNVLGRKP